MESRGEVRGVVYSAEGMNYCGVYFIGRRRGIAQGFDSFVTAMSGAGD